VTVIAWDGVSLAADKRAVQGGGIVRTVAKIERHGDELLAITGSYDIGAELREWYKAGACAADFPQSARKDEATLIVVDAFGVRTFCAGPYSMRHEDEKLAFGSGRDFAQAAMYCGKSARDAVAVACIFQSDCGNGIDVLRLR